MLENPTYKQEMLNHLVEFSTFGKA
jgi:hypothetical protein